MAKGQQDRFKACDVCQVKDCENCKGVDVVTMLQARRQVHSVMIAPQTIQYMGHTYRKVVPDESTD